MKSFFPPIKSTFKYRKGKTLTDNDLLRAWHGIPTEKIRAMGLDADDPESQTRDNPDIFARVDATRARVIALREERGAKL